MTPDAPARARPGACTADRWPRGEVSRWRRSRHGCCRGDRARGRRVNELARRRFRVLPRTPREPRNVRGWRFQEALGAPWRMCSARRGRIVAGGSRPSPGACDWSSVELYPCLGGVGRARRASGSKRASVSSSHRGRCRTAGGGGPGRQRRRSSFSRDEPSVRVDSQRLPAEPSTSGSVTVRADFHLAARSPEWGGRYAATGAVSGDFNGDRRLGLVGSSESQLSLRVLLNTGGAQQPGNARAIQFIQASPAVIARGESVRLAARLRCHPGRLDLYRRPHRHSLGGRWKRLARVDTDARGIAMYTDEPRVSVEYQWRPTNAHTRRIKPTRRRVVKVNSTARPR